MPETLWGIFKDFRDLRDQLPRPKTAVACLVCSASWSWMRVPKDDGLLLHAAGHVMNGQLQDVGTREAPRFKPLMRGGA